MNDGFKKYREDLKAGLVVRKVVKRPSDVKAMKDKCKDCMSDYVDGRVDCEIETCPLYYRMPYGKIKKAKRKVLNDIQAKRF